jgi:hypothetical protein
MQLFDYHHRTNSIVQLPYLQPSKKTETQIADLVNLILSAKQENPAADTFSFESEIDQLVYQLFELTEEDISQIMVSK